METKTCRLTEAGRHGSLAGMVDSKEARAARQAAALRRNLQRRKAQGRLRREEASDALEDSADQEQARQIGNSTEKQQKPTG